MSKRLLEKANSIKSSFNESQKNIPITPMNPITVPGFPSPISINAQNPKNFHVNMNITNINFDKSHSILKTSMQPTITCDRDLKVKHHNLS